jgi:hypothetical protein
MSQRAKVYARTFAYAIPADLPEGQMKITVEWKRILGGRQAGKVTFTVDDITSNDKLNSDLRDMLATHLSQKFAPEVFKPRDIVGYSV